MRTIEEVKDMFAYAHLRDDLRDVSEHFHNLAVAMFEKLEPCPETTLCLRKLWEAKNYAVWVAAKYAAPF